MKNSVTIWKTLAITFFTAAMLAGFFGWTAKVNSYEYSYIFAVYDENVSAITDSFDVLPK